MRYTFEWLEAPWLLLATMEGVVTLPEYQDFTVERMQYLNEAYQRIYCICDWSRVDPKLPPEATAAMLKTPAHAHPRVGVMAVVGNQTMLKFIATSIVQQSVKKNTQQATQVFTTLEEAIQFCRTKAALDREAEAIYSR
jgi:hypothetical protein